MTTATLDKLEAAYREHETYVLGTLARRSSFIAPGDRRGVYHDAFALVLEKARDGRLDLEAMGPRQLRAYLAKTAVLIALDQIRWGERARTRPLTDSDLERSNGDAPAEEQVAADSELAPLREIVAELPQRRQAVVKLRFFFDRDPDEVQRLLGISARTYRLEIERALRHIAERYELAREGRWCEDRRSLILAYVAGIAGPRKADEARMHLHACPGCAHLAAELRQAAEKAAAVIPMPDVAVHDGPLHRAVELAAGARDQLGELTGHAKQHAVSLVARADPTSSGNVFASARPGAVAAAVAGCVAIGGGATYCAVEGVPDPLKPALGIERTQSAPKEHAKPDRDRPVTAPVGQPTPTSAPTPQAPAASSPAPAQSSPPPTPKSDFDFEQSAPSATASGAGSSSTSSNRTARPAPAAPGPEFGP